MQVAHEYSKLSSAIRLKVGAIVVKDDRIISIGYNGMPSGWSNDCEDRIYMDSDVGGWLSSEEIEERFPYADETGLYYLTSKPEVMHAEANALTKLAGSTESGKHATIFITHAPCIECAKLIYQSGIKEVYYANEYRSNQGINFLDKCGVTVKQCQKNIA